MATTRRRDAALRGDGRAIIDQVEFTESEAVGYLRQRLSSRDDTNDQLAGLAADLGHLPLTLAQASAYISDQGLTCEQYRRLLGDQQRKLSDLVPDTESLPDDHRLPVAAAWRLSSEAANGRTNGLAGPVLELASLLSPNGIPTTLLLGHIARAHYAKTGNAPVKPEDVEAALRVLHNLNLIDHHHADGVVRVHAMVQRTTRDSLAPDQLHTTAHTAADALVEAWPDPEPADAQVQTLRANTFDLHRYSGDALYHPAVHRVLFKLGISLADTGQLDAAVSFGEQLHDRCRTHHGPDHPDTLVTRGNLATFRGEAGDVAGAVVEFERLLADAERVLGPDHPDTLAARGKLAGFRGDAGDVAGAVAEYERFLADVERVVGSGHPGTFAARGKLAGFRGDAGDVAGAMAEHERLRADMERMLGPDHPDTLAARNYLATFRGDAGDAGGAVAEFEQLLPDVERVLGPDHPDTLTTRGKLATFRGQAGDVAGAVAEYERLLADVERMLGSDHPDAVTFRASLEHIRHRRTDTPPAP